MDRGYVFGVLVVAFLFLEGGAYLLEHGGEFSVFATPLYVVGVSLYSACLVGYGALAAEGGSRWRISSRAGVVFALGGWFGSAMGIGMARDMRSVPVAFLLVALLLALSALLARWRLWDGTRLTKLNNA
ncbi:hypothetical protein VDG1235_1745 [Verrucomicrobiia bacterium DG1235]|nr:hypothetical protein VDG1235_1745 [Verrucomicrobiae bacterium DG1235]